MRLAVILVVVIILISSSVASAFEPPNQRHYPGIENNRVLPKVAATGVLTWQVVDSYGWSAWRDVVAASLNSGSPYMYSLGNVLNFYLSQDRFHRIEIREAWPSETADVVHFAVPTAFLESKCGTWATACIYMYSARPVPAYYRAALMVSLPFEWQSHVVQHETFHVLANACDQYRGGCPRISDGRWDSTVQCLGNPDTLMDCGGAALYPQPYDYVTFVTAYPANAVFLQRISPREMMAGATIVGHYLAVFGDAGLAPTIARDQLSAALGGRLCSGARYTVEDKLAGISMVVHFLAVFGSAEWVPAIALDQAACSI